MNRQKEKLWQRRQRRLRVRAKIFGTSKKPRLSVYRSLRYMYAQLIDDSTGTTLASASSKTLSLDKKNSMQAAAKVGERIAKQASQSGITAAVFDRSLYKYHGKIKALADAARKHGLKF